MKKDVLISIRGTQTTPDGEPETIELTTVGTLEQIDKRTILSYQESDLTGLDGTTTSFYIEPGRIVLERVGTVESVMEFEEGKCTESLYRIAEGALLLRVYARKMEVHLESVPGWFSLIYGIEIEGTPTGTIDYHITVHPES